jgi:dimethylargininase
VLRNAIVRPPGANFAGGLTTAKLGSPDHGRALAQHGAYSDALERCGLTLTRLPEDLAHADSTFVEGTAVLTTDRAILARPGAPSRAGEVPAVRNALSAFYRELRAIAAPGTLDGGLAYLGDRKYVAIEALAGHSALRGRHVIVADAAESYAPTASV